MHALKYLSLIDLAHKLLSNYLLIGAGYGRVQSPPSRTPCRRKCSISCTPDAFKQVLKCQTVMKHSQAAYLWRMSQVSI